MSLALEDNKAASAPLCNVLCKLPNGLRLRLYDMVEVDQQTPLGIRSVKEAQHRGDIADVLIRGTAYYKGDTVPLLLGGYAVTTNVSTEFMAEWFRQNASHPAVKNGMIRTAHDMEDARAIGREGAKVRSGGEPMDQEGDPRRPVNNTLKIEKGTAAEL